MGLHHYFSATTSQAATKSFTYVGRRMERIEEEGGVVGGSRFGSAQLQRSSSGLLPPPRFTSTTAQICRRCPGSMEPHRFAVAAQVPRRRRPGSPPPPPRFAAAAAQVHRRRPVRRCCRSRRTSQPPCFLSPPSSWLFW
jgi:hypothetical protein